MAEYIEREALYKEVTEKYHDINGGQYPFNVVAYDMAQLVKSAPTADVVEVVRCSKCKHWGGVTFGFICRKFSGENTKICMHADDFCSCGERRSENENT